MTTAGSRPNSRRASTRKTLAIVSVVCLVLAVVVAIGFASHGTVSPSASIAPANAKLSIGQTAPEFAVSTTGGPFDLAQNGGKPTLLEVFATWCPHCQRETAVLDRIFARYGSRVNVVAVSGSAQGIDGTSPETQADVVAFAEHFAAKYPIAFDPNLAVANAYLQGGFPTLVTIDAHNVIRSIESGEIAEPTIAKSLDAALARK